MHPHLLALVFGLLATTTVAAHDPALPNTLNPGACGSGGPRATAAMLRPAGVHITGITTHEAAATLDVAPSPSRLSEVEVSCTRGRPAFVFTFEGEEPNADALALVLAISRAVARRLPETSTTWPRVVAACFSTRAATYDAADRREGITVAAGPIEMFCDTERREGGRFETLVHIGDRY